MLKEFKAFAMRGNVVDMAVGIIIGGAFGKIVTSLVNDVIMPPFGVLLGGMDFASLSLTVRAAAGDAPAVTLNYGAFINTVVNFLIVAAAIFMVIKAINRLKRQQPVPPPEPTEKTCPECCLTVPLRARKCGHCASALS